MAVRACALNNEAQILQHRTIQTPYILTESTNNKKKTNGSAETTPAKTKMRLLLPAPATLSLLYNSNTLSRKDIPSYPTAKGKTLSPPPER